MILRRVNSLRMGVIEGAPSNDAERTGVNVARAAMLASLRDAGPRLRKKFEAEDWERSFNASGDCVYATTKTIGEASAQVNENF